MGPGSAVDAYLRAVRDAATQTLGGDVVGVYTTGSLALDAFVPGRSDVDVLVVAKDDTPEAKLRAFAAAIAYPRLACPATGLELAVVGRSAAASATPVAGYLLEVNTGPELPPLLDLGPERPSHWYVIDRAVCRQSGTALLGPPPADLIAAVGRADALAALAESVSHQYDKLGEWLTDSTVLNACRAWRYVVDDRWYAKTDAGAWAVTQPRVDADLVRLAMETHRYGGRAAAARVPVDRARAFVAHVLDLVRSGVTADRS